MSKRIHNVIFVILLGVILGATAYALHVKLPSLGFSLYDIELPRKAESWERSKKTSETERMIENGELSDHEARYYHTLD